MGPKKRKSGNPMGQRWRILCDGEAIAPRPKLNNDVSPRKELLEGADTLFAAGNRA
jgi:hypothetical protein